MNYHDPKQQVSNKALFPAGVVPLDSHDIRFGAFDVSSPCLPNGRALQGVHSRDVTRRTRWRTFILSWILSDNTFTGHKPCVCCHQKEIEIGLPCCHRGTTVSHASDPEVSTCRDLQCLKKAAGVRVLFSFKSYPVTARKGVRTGGGNLTALMTSIPLKSSDLHVMSLKLLLYENLLVIHPSNHLTCDISKNLGQETLVKVVFVGLPNDWPMYELEGQTVKNSRFFVEFSLCYWEFPCQQKRWVSLF